MPLCIANGYEGYFPMREAYDEGGYEARSSIFKGGRGRADCCGGQGASGATSGEDVT